MLIKLRHHCISTLLFVFITLPVFAQPGTLDLSFATDGTTTTAITAGATDQAYGMVIQPDGKIIVTGASGTGPNDDIAVVRYNTDGTLDNTFDSDGIVTTPIGLDDVGFAPALQTDGKIVVAGYTGDNGTAYDIVVLRYNVDGSLDNTFDTDGIAVTDFGAEDRGYSVAIQTDGKIVVSGSVHNGTNFDIAVVRYNTDGSLDNTFDGDGKLVTPIGTNDHGYDVVIQTNGRIVVAGRSFSGTSWDFALVRYDTNGALDNTFGGTGIVTTDIITSSYDIGNSIALQGDGKLVVSGYTYVGSFTDVSVARYHTDGSLDNTFDGDGKLTTSIGIENDQSFGVAVQTNGKIVASCSTNDGTYSNFGVVRYNTDGSLDNTFDGDGKVVTSVDTFLNASYAVAIQSDGKIVAAGFSFVGGGSNDFSVARYHGDPITSGMENIEVMDLNIYPNPAHMCFTIQTAKINDEKLTCTIVNSMGQQVYRCQMDPGELKMNIQSLIAGIYTIIVENSYFRGIKKLVIQ
jgi:uncharacterized delta-60 repeat protein